MVEDLLERQRLTVRKFFISLADGVPVKNRKRGLVSTNGLESTNVNGVLFAIR